MIAERLDSTEETTSLTPAIPAWKRSRLARTWEPTSSSREADSLAISIRKARSSWGLISSKKPALMSSSA